MNRFHLFEFTDQSWLPASLRDLNTEFLQEALVLGQDFYGPAAELLTRVLKATGARKIVDLCSGASGPWIRLKPRLEERCGHLELLLTDKYPNLESLRRAVKRIGDGRTSIRTSPVDATAVPADLTGVRTIFTGFHHLPPAVACRTLADAFHTRTAICVFEHSQRTVGSVASCLLAPLLCAAYAFTRRPFSARRFALTFLLPVAPIIATWDGVVSALRTYSVAELQTMTSSLSAADYRWETGRVPGSGGRPTMTYLLGYPATG